MQYNYYSLYNITEARASDKHLARIEKAAKDQNFDNQMSGLKTDLDVGEWRRAKKAALPAEAAQYLKNVRSSAAETEKGRKKLGNLYRQEERLKTHIQDRKGEQGKSSLTDRQLRIKEKVAENKARLKSEAAENKTRLEAAAKKKAAQHKTKIQQHGRKQKLGAVLAAGGLAGAGALLKSAHDDVTG